VYKVANDWVESHFTEEALAVVQRVQSESKVRYSDKDSAETEHGFLSLKNENKRNKYKYDDRQVSMIKYLPAKVVRNLAGQNVKKDAIWKGIIVSKNGASEFVTLEQDWIDKNIDKTFQEFLKELRDKNKEGYVRIPEGANDKHEEGTYRFHTAAPLAKYWCKRNSGPNRKCLFYSLASGLYHLGQKKVAFKIGSARESLVVEGWRWVAEIIKNHTMMGELNDSKYRMLGKKEIEDWNMIRDAPKFQLCILGVMSSDGKTDHAICVVKDWIFDANYERGLTLTVESLDLCCSSSDRFTTYVKVTRGYVMQDRT
jgi:hypothetical protein